MRPNPLAMLASVLLASSALANALDEVTTKGLKVMINGTPVGVNFTPNGRFSMFNGLIAGKWRVDGDKLCTIGDADAKETCDAYPRGKKSGDTFDVQTPNGPLTVQIK